MSSRVDPKVQARAQGAVSGAIIAGRLAKPSACEVCGLPWARVPGRSGIEYSTVVYHHWSYEEQRWLDVIPLCLSCHAGVHSGRLLEPRTGRRYRNLKTIREETPTP